MATVTKATKPEPKGLVNFTSKIDNIKALLVGRSGTGKTHFSGSFPKPFFINTDKGMATLMDKNIPFVTIERMTEDNRNDENALTSWKDVWDVVQGFKTKSGAIYEELKKAGYIPETIVLDSISSLSDLLEVEVIVNPPDKKDRSDTLFLSDYNIIQRRLYSILDALRELDTHVVATAGIDLSQDEVGRMLENPAATGNKLGPRIPHFFDEVYYHSYDDKAKVWRLTPIQTSRFPHAKSRLGLEFQPIDNPTFEKVTKAMAKFKVKK